MEINVKFRKIKEEVKVPSYAHVGDAAMDLYSLEQRTLERGEPHLFYLGFASEFDQGHVALIQDRSSMGKRGVRTLGGVIDSNYRGEWGVILVNVTDKEVLIKPGDRIAQVLFIPVAQATITSSDSLSESERGEGGFGSSGK